MMETCRVADIDNWRCVIVRCERSCEHLLRPKSGMFWCVLMTVMVSSHDAPGLVICSVSNLVISNPKQILLFIVLLHLQVIKILAETYFIFIYFFISDICQSFLTQYFSIGIISVLFYFAILLSFERKYKLTIHIFTLYMQLWTCTFLVFTSLHIITNSNHLKNSYIRYFNLERFDVCLTYLSSPFLYF